MKKIIKYLLMSFLIFCTLSFFLYSFVKAEEAEKAVEKVKLLEYQIKKLKDEKKEADSLLLLNSK